MDSRVSLIVLSTWRFSTTRLVSHCPGTHIHPTQAGSHPDTRNHRLSITSTSFGQSAFSHERRRTAETRNARTRTKQRKRTTAIRKWRRAERHENILKLNLLHHLCEHEGSLHSATGPSLLGLWPWPETTFGWSRLRSNHFVRTQKSPWPRRRHQAKQSCLHLSSCCGCGCCWARQSLFLVHSQYWPHEGPRHLHLVR